ncbi:MAG: glycine cleavage system protein GcvH [Fretibacterium sp.]|nr:glycine cleavage system protein GcvH [Fretibacterium sp.]
MKAYDDLVFKSDVSYSKTHEWAKKDGNIVRVGVDDYAQGALGDIVYVELPDVGDTVKANAACGSLESTKAVSDLNSPVSGKVVAVNEALEDSPDLVNTSPYDEGWTFEVEVADSKDFDAMMKVDAYKDFVKNLEN